MDRDVDDVIAGLKEKLALAVDNREHVAEMFADELSEIISHMERMLAEVREHRR